MPTLGPGTLKIGATGSEIDASCLVNSITLTPTKDQGDSKTMLCGTVKQGSVKYTWELTGNLDIDLEAGEAGLLALSYEAKGSEQTFSYIPNTEDGTEFAGTLVLDPLDVGADEYGADLSSDFAFAVVGEPTITWPVVVP